MVDLAKVRSRADFGRALDELRAGLSYRDIAKRAAERNSARPLPAQTANNAVTKGRLKLDTLEVFLEVCDVPDAERQAWRNAWQRAQTADLDGQRVLDADPYLLGIHQPIGLPGAEPRTLPSYVRREADAGELGIRARLRAMAKPGGFLLIIGGSSVGKTRTAYEAIRAEFGGWQLVHPGGAAQLEALAGQPPDGPAVVWLDELRDFLDGETRLTAGTVRSLLSRPIPVVLIATIWPDDYHTYTQLPAASGRPDPGRHAREVLRLADRVFLDAAFTADEIGRARDAAAVGDAWIAAWLDLDSGYSLPEHLAAAPALEDHRATAPPYAKAVLLAALDAHRLGARAPLPLGLLEAAAVDYCTSREQAEAPAEWFEQAVAHNTRRLHGSTSAFVPVGAGMGVPTGYLAADYLRQKALHTRRGDRAPASLWTALRDHLTDLDDIERVASAALDRRLYVIAVPLLRALVDDGDWEAANRLAELFADAGDLPGLEALADAGGEEAADRLAELLAKAGDRTALRTRTEAGDWYAAGRFVDLLVQDRDRDGLRVLVDAGYEMAAGGLAGLLAEDGDREAAIAILEGSAKAGDLAEARLLNRLLAEVGDRERLRVRADAGDRDAAGRLAGLFAEAGDREGLRARADAGDGPAAIRLADLLADAGDHVNAVAILRTWADAGDWPAASRLAGLLAEAGDREGLQELADGGYWDASSRLAEFLAKAGDLDALRARADAEDGWAAHHLDQLLAKAGDHRALRERLDAGDERAARPLADLLTDIGDRIGAIEVLRGLADAGDSEAGERLAALLVEVGDHEGLRARADAGDGEAADRLAALLAEAGDHEGLRVRADAGDWWAARRLAELQANTGDDRLLQFGFDVDGSVADHRGW